MPKEMRTVFGETLVELGREYPKMLVLDADLHTSSKSVLFKEAFPQRFIQVGIAEQNMFGIAAGLASEGYTPFASTFACFAARRALDQIAISIAYPRLNVKIPGSYVGLPTSRAGASHNCIEDIAVMRAMPHMRVVDPGDNTELRAVMHACMEYDGPVYFRVTRLTLPDLFDESYRFQWGTGALLRPRHDVTLVGTGMMTHLCLRAADLLAGEGIRAEVLHMGSIKPLDTELLVESAGRTGAVVTAENGTIIGGLGSAVAEVLAETVPVPVRRVGVRDRFVESGGIDELFTEHHMQPEDIAAAALEAIRAKAR
mgnify:CR=1 FL=1